MGSRTGFPGAFFDLVEDELEVLAVQVQGGEPYMWARHEEGDGAAPRHFSVRGTGHLLSGDEGRYVGTFQMAGGLHVWHLFEAVPS